MTVIFSGGTISTGSTGAPAYWPVADPGYPLSAVDPTGLERLWAEQPSLRKVVSFIARNIASIPLHAYERVADGDRRRITTGPLAELLRHPSPQSTAYRFWSEIVTDWLLHDRWCAYKTVDDRPGLLRIAARRTTFVADENGVLRYIEVDGRRDMRLNPTECVWDHGYGGPNGVSPVRALRSMLDESAESVAWRRQVWRQGARVPAVIERPADAPAWSPEARHRFSESWSRYSSGGGREGGTPILEDGMTLQKVDAFSPRDSQDIEGRQLTDAEVASAYHIPPELVGARQGTYSNIEAFRQMLYRDALGPHIAALEQAVNLMLVADLAGPDTYVEAHVESKLRGSFEQQAQILQSAVGGPWMLRSEARGRMNLPEIDHADELIVPLNVTTGGLANPRDTTPKARGAKSVTDDDDVDDLATLDVERDLFEVALAEFFAHQEAALLSALGVKASPPSLFDAWDSDRWDAALATVYTRHGRRVARVGADAITSKYPATDAWSPSSMDAYVAKWATGTAEAVNTATYQRLAATVVEGTWPAGAVAAFAGTNPAALAVTATTAMAGFGGHDAAKHAGLKFKRWSTTSKNPRPSHAAANGQVVPMDDAFTVGGDAGRWPGDTSLPPWERMECRCSVEFDISEEDL